MSIAADPVHSIAVATPYARVLEPLLEALRWRGGARQLAEAVNVRQCRDLSDVRNALANLNFVSEMKRLRLRDVDRRLLPCLFVSDDGAVLVVLDESDAPGALYCFDAAANEEVDVFDLDVKGHACFFTLDEASNDVYGAGYGSQWLTRVATRFDGSVVRLLALSFALSMLALVPAFFVQAVYDRVLATQDRSALFHLALGCALALGSDLVLRLVRGAVIAHIGARLDFLVGSAVFRKMINQPLGRMEAASVGVQIGRIREQEGLRHAFTGQMALAVCDLPFIFVYVAAIAVIGGWLAVIPVGLTLILAGMGFAIVHYLRRSSIAAQAPGDMQSLLVELLSNMRAVKTGANEALWLARFRERSAHVAFANLRHARISAITENMAQAINLLAGATTLSVGALLALSGGVTVGALIGSMALVWRVLAPLQALFVAANRVHEIRRSVQSLNQLMALPIESAVDGRSAASTRGRQFAGAISFQRVLFRYAPHHEPALNGAAFDIAPGEIIAITGGNGSGKSSALKLVANLYQAQAGGVLIDGVDTRHMNPIDLRQSLAYLPQRTDMFSGSIAENLRFATPHATIDELRDVTARVGLLDVIEGFPGGFDAPLHPGTDSDFIRRLGLARTLLRDASIVLLDEPSISRGEDGADVVLEVLDALRGRATVLLVTHNPDHVGVADRVIVLRQGAVVHDGPPRELMTRLAGAAR